MKDEGRLAASQRSFTWFPSSGFTITPLVPKLRLGNLHPRCSASLAETGHPHPTLAPKGPNIPAQGNALGTGGRV